MSIADEVMKLKDGQILYNDVCDRLKKKADVIINSASGNPATITDGADKLPIPSLHAGFLPIQNLNGYDNPWPAGGGKNLWSFGNFVIGNNIPFSLPAGTYTVSCVATENVGIRFFYGEGTENSVVANMTNSNNHVSTIILPSACIAINASVNNSGTVTNVQIESGSSATSYAPYSNICPITGWTGMNVYHGEDQTDYDTYPITWTESGAVCGGYVDLISGELWKTWLSVNSSELTWVYSSTYDLFIAVTSTPGYKKPSYINILSDRYKTVNDPLTNMPDLAIRGHATSNNIYVKDDSFNHDETTFAASNFQIVYELATPVLVATLDPIELRTLLGTNTIWSNANGSIEIDYPSDTKKYVDLYEGVKDVKINGTSVTQDGVANVPLGTANNPGAVQINTGRGLTVTDGKVQTNPATSAELKAGANGYKPIVPNKQHEAAFYALAKLVGADMASSSNPVGTYTDAAIQGIQKLLGLAGLLGPYEDDITADRAYAIGETFVMDGKRYRATAAISQDTAITPGTNCEPCPLTLSDIQIDGTTILNNGVADIPKVGKTELGVAKVGSNGGYGLDALSDGTIIIYPASVANAKSGSTAYRPIVPASQHASVFYGLAKLAGADMASLTGETVGVYPQAQKTAIQTMLGVSTGATLIEEVSGLVPSITALPNVRYKCDEVSTISITPPASGTCEVIFTSGSTPAVLTVPNTVKFPPWFDATSLEANKIYDIMITDGVYGAVMTWES